jgi:hypothetical protein
MNRHLGRFGQALASVDPHWTYVFPECIPVVTFGVNRDHVETPSRSYRDEHERLKVENWFMHIFTTGPGFQPFVKFLRLFALEQALITMSGNSLVHPDGGDTPLPRSPLPRIPSYSLV